MPPKVMVSARVEEGRITGLGKTNLQASEVMGILGGVLNEFVLFIDPIVATAKPALKPPGKKKSAKTSVPVPVKKDASLDGGPAEAAPAPVPEDIGSDLAVRPAVVEDHREETLVGKGEIRPLHDRVEVLNPEALESFPCTSSRIPILDDGTGEKGPHPVKRRKNKQAQDTASARENLTGENRLHSTDPQGSGHNGLTDHAATERSVQIDPTLMLKGENGEEISDAEMLF